MAIKVYGEFIVPGVGGDLSQSAVVTDAKYVRGAFQSVQLFSEIDGSDNERTIPNTGIVEGMQVYVVESGLNYRRTSGVWVVVPSNLTNTLTSIQNTAVTGLQWTHNMGYVPTVNVFCNGNQIIPRINHININLLELYFNPPASGTIYVS